MTGKQVAKQPLRTRPETGSPSLRCPHGLDHPTWCSVCRRHWQARMRHPSWPRVAPEQRRPV